MAPDMTTEGYVLHSYGPEEYLRHVVACATTIRRYDARRPIALFCQEQHEAILRDLSLTGLFDVVEHLPPANRSITGFKHRLGEFMPFKRCLYLDSDMVWCRNPDPLWSQLSAFRFTATGHDRADFFFGGPKGLGVLREYLLDTRRRTMMRFGLTHLPRIQAGMIYSQDRGLAEQVSALSAEYLARRMETHFRSRLHEGRSEESCEWSLAMAFSRLELPVFPWFQGSNSPQLDFVAGLTSHDADFSSVTCRYYCDRFVYSLRGLGRPALRDALIRILTSIPGKGDYIDVTPYVLHFGWLRHKAPFRDLSLRIWERLTQKAELSVAI